MKVTIEGYIHFKKQEYGETLYSFWRYDDMADQGYVYVCPYNIEFELPEDFDPRGRQIEILERRKRKVQAEFQATLNRINDEISKLQAITYDPEAA